MHYLAGSQVFVEVQNELELDVVNLWVAAIQELYEVPANGWTLVKPHLEMFLLHGRQTRDSDDMSARQLRDLADVTNKVSNINLPFERKRSASEYDFLQGCLDSVEEYVNERGMLQTVVCPTCNTYLPIWLIFFERISLAWLALTELVDDETIPAAAKERLAEVMSRSLQHPDLHRELRTIGMAWCQPLLDDLHERQGLFPEALPDEWIAGVLARFLGISPVAFDPSIPFAPVNRVVKDDEGEVRVREVGEEV